MLTVQKIAQRFKSIGIDIPHPLPETVRIAEEAQIVLHCVKGLDCYWDYKCIICDSYMQMVGIVNVADLTEYLVSPHLIVRMSARIKFEELQEEGLKSCPQYAK